VVLSAFLPEICRHCNRQKHVFFSSHMVCQYIIHKHPIILSSTICQTDLDYYYLPTVSRFSVYALRMTKHQLEANLLLMFLKSCPLSINLIVLRFPTRKLRGFPQSRFSLSFKKCPPARYARRQSITLSQILYYFYFHIIGWQLVRG
jgi:hypothetical protein